MPSQKIVPNLWCNNNAKEVAEFYGAVFPNSSVHAVTNYPKTAEEGLADFQASMAGEILTIDFSLAGYEFTAINAGPEFVPTPANSFMVNFDPGRDDNARMQLEVLWKKLSEDGVVLMPLQKYDFSEYYGWVQDKHGVSWQLILTKPEGDERPFIIPSLLFGGPHQNRAAEARAYYLDVFRNSRAGSLVLYEADAAPVRKGDVMFSDFQLEGQWFVAMDSGVEQGITFTEAVSYSIACEDQAEIDYYWSKLSAHPANEQCGWCKDRFGVSWQIVPATMGELMQKPGAYKTMMNQKKIIIAEY